MTMPTVAAIVPCYRVRAHILDVLATIGPDVASIYVIDDACPEDSGALVAEACGDPRVRVIRRAHNGGVGAATLTGFDAAAAEGATILVKIDGDGQMDPAAIPRLVRPILTGAADYSKGNRFFSPEFVRGMPALRLLGNAVLSFMTKLSSGYWDVFDPTNGFVALHADVFRVLPRRKIAARFFFESDLLFRLNLVRARVIDIPIEARYAGERSNLAIGRIVGPFLGGHARNFVKRVVYSYLLRDFSTGSIFLLCGLPLCLAGTSFGTYEWIAHARAGVTASAGTVMAAALPVIVGFQLLLSFLGYDITSVPRTALHPRLTGAVWAFRRRDDAPPDPGGAPE
jgi:glycosyltransferase involved in cell wall biosynthesis